MPNNGTLRERAVVFRPSPRQDPSLATPEVLRHFKFLWVLSRRPKGFCKTMLHSASFVVCGSLRVTSPVDLGSASERVLAFAPRS